MNANEIAEKIMDAVRELRLDLGLEDGFRTKPPYEIETPKACIKMALMHLRIGACLRQCHEASPRFAEGMRSDGEEEFAAAQGWVDSALALRRVQFGKYVLYR